MKLLIDGLPVGHPCRVAAKLVRKIEQAREEISKIEARLPQEQAELDAMCKGKTLEEVDMAELGRKQSVIAMLPDLRERNEAAVEEIERELGEYLPKLLRPFREIYEVRISAAEALLKEGFAPFYDLGNSNPYAVVANGDALKKAIRECPFRLNEINRQWYSDACLQTNAQGTPFNRARKALALFETLLNEPPVSSPVPAVASVVPEEKLTETATIQAEAVLES